MHREAIKQSAIDPLSGKIDITILTTGISTGTRKRRKELCDAIQKLIESKDKIHILNQQKLFAEIKQSSELVSKSIVHISIIVIICKHQYLRKLLKVVIIFSLLHEICLMML